MARPSLPPAAEALFRAHQDKSTGWLTLLCGGREAKLYLQHGDLVGARLGFGHQTEPQALLAVGALVPPALDLLWSRGQLGDPARVCEAAGVDPTVLSEVRALASVRRVATLTEEASFMPALVEMTFPRVRGTRAVRAAFEALPAVPATAWVRCRDVSAAEPFLAGADERTFLASLGEFRAAEALSAVQSALLRALEHAGLVDILSPEEWEARAGAERVEAARRAEEDTRREAARHALEAARAAEEHRQAGMRDRADAARRALESARAAEADWRNVRDGNGDAERPEVRTTEHEFPAGAPARRPPPSSGLRRPSAPPSSSSTRSRRTCLRSSLLPRESGRRAGAGAHPHHAPAVRGAGARHRPDGRPRRSRPRWVTRTRWCARRSRRAATPTRTLRCRRCPRRARAGRSSATRPLRHRPLRSGDRAARRQTDPYAQALARDRPLEGTDEIPTPPSRPFAFPQPAASPTPVGGTAEARTPPGGVVLESEELVLEPEALMLSTPEGEPTPAAGTLVEELSEALRRAGLGGAPGSLPGSQHRGGGQQASGADPAPARPGGQRARGRSPGSWWTARRPSQQARSRPRCDRSTDSWRRWPGCAPPTDPDNPSTVPLATTDLDALVRASFESGEWTLALPARDRTPRQRPHRPRRAQRHSGARPPPPMERTSTAGAVRRAPPGAAPPGARGRRSANRWSASPRLRRARSRTPSWPRPSRPATPALSRDPDRFAVLGLPPGSGRDDVKRAFIELAKVFHPDRLPRSLHPAPSEGGPGVRRHPGGPGVPPRRCPPGRARRPVAQRSGPRQRSGGCRGGAGGRRDGDAPARVRAGRSLLPPGPRGRSRDRPPSPPRPGPSTWTPPVGARGSAPGR